MKRVVSSIVVFILFVFAQRVDAQNLDIEGITKSTKLKVNGNINANAIYYNSNTRNARIPFTYFVQGTINLNWLTFNVPFTYSYSNQGENFDYQLPFNFNRLSLHPRYKWIQAHIGDVTMNFSPYTLSGHQFTGGGVELTPNFPLKFSAMYGRLLRATEDDGNEQTLPAYKRVGYGAKLSWEKPRYKLGLIGFYAKDNINSILPIPEERNIRPKENLVISLSGETTIARKYIIRAEYASTAITQDLRADKSTISPNNLAGLFFNNRTSTEFYNALRAGIDLNLGAMKVGLGYERIDPNYETLGAYYFNNDFENITLNLARTLFNNKVNISFNLGYQRDNLNNQKTQSLGRTVGSVNATYQVTDAITLTGMYSNFTSFTNQNLNQFDDINDNDLTDEEQEALNYRQLSQNANANLNWVLSKKKNSTQTVNLNYSLASSANEENGIIRVGQANNFHNGNAVYTIGFPQNSLTVSSSVNYSYNDIGRDNSNAWGTSLNLNKLFFKNKLNTTLGAAYNNSINKEIKTGVLNFRASAGTVLAKKHNISLNAIQLFRNTTNVSDLSELTLTFNYSYAFDVSKPKIEFNRTPREKKVKTPKIKKEKVFKFSYRKHTFEGKHENITREIKTLVEQEEFKTVKGLKQVLNDLELLAIDMKEHENGSNKKYKKTAINYLDLLYKYKDFSDTYHDIAFKSLQKLYTQAVALDERVKQDYIRLRNLVNAEKQMGNFVLESDEKDLLAREKKYKAHTWMQEQLVSLTYEDVINDKGLLKEFKEKYLDKVFSMIMNKKSEKEIEDYFSLKYAKFYHDNAPVNKK
ncbi:TonB-dependent receptor [Tenacibaculum jejuense]|uniref:Outer membrane protein beta-barrel domain-containing protein n=1 Tax=Tenacibaculum jejuense TaxID=584609 RepID=A0A238U7I4_9FLAO|nr:hypothetical protein [Tenacibaculum jejuense]SNR14558.1 Protein of unknown function precursor [Tenacibaculum jejuense]